ncbi:MAG: 3'-5' exonuclease, partial [Flavobacteriales bacterium]
GFAPRDIAVLVRGRTDGRRAAEALANDGFAVASPDGAQLASNPSARLVIDLLRVIDAGDAEAALRAWQALAPGGCAGGGPFDPFAELQGKTPLESVRRWLIEHGNPALRTTIASLIGQLLQALGIDPAHDAQLMALLDEAHDFGIEHGQHLGGFIGHWERKGGARSTVAAGDGAIQVMTIHKSKGLQFPVVIIPSAAMAGQRVRQDRIWVGELPEIPGLPAMPLRIRNITEQFRIAALEEERDLTRLDHLNLLYVAFTRPEQRLYAAVPPDRSGTMSDALRTFIRRENPAGELAVGVEQPPWRRNDAAPPEPLIAPPLPRRPLPLRIEAPQEWDPRDPAPQRRWGNLAHEALRRTTSADSLREALLGMEREGLVGTDEARRLGDAIGPVLRSHALRPWFGPGLQVRNEASLITAEGHALRPDRIVIEGDAVRVLDYKTGAPSERHHEQVRSYLAALRAMGHTRVEGALLYIRDGALQHVEAP